MYHICSRLSRVFLTFFGAFDSTVILSLSPQLFSESPVIISQPNSLVKNFFDFFQLFSGAFSARTPHDHPRLPHLFVPVSSVSPVECLHIITQNFPIVNTFFLIFSKLFHRVTQPLYLVFSCDNHHYFQYLDIDNLKHPANTTFCKAIIFLTR